MIREAASRSPDRCSTKDLGRRRFHLSSHPSCAAKGFSLRELDILSARSDSRLRMRLDSTRNGVPIGTNRSTWPTAKTKANLFETRTMLFDSRKSHQRGLECRLIREIRSARRRDLRSRCAIVCPSRRSERNCAALRRSIRSRRGTKETGARRAILGRMQAAGGSPQICRRRTSSGRRDVTGPSYQRSRELTRKGSAPVAAGAAVLSTTTLVPTRARL